MKTPNLTWYRKSGGKLGYNYKLYELIMFLVAEGFAIVKVNSSVEQRITQLKKGNVISEVSPQHIKDFLKTYVKNSVSDLETANAVVDFITCSNFISEKKLIGLLPTRNYNFVHSNKNSQLFFFSNGVAVINKYGVSFVQGTLPEHYAWEDNVKKRDFKLDNDPQFHILKDRFGNWDIYVLEKQNPFFNVLINTSRIAWQEECGSFADKSKQDYLDYVAANKFNIAGPALSFEQQLEQKRNLINKIYAIGYLLHSYKDFDKNWIVTAQDFFSFYSGTGKSFVFKMLYNFLNGVYIKGRDTNALQNRYIFDEVEENCDVILVDDANEGVDFAYFFCRLQLSDVEVNAVHKKPFRIGFNLFPKIAITANHIPLDESSLRRTLPLYFSDYYYVNDHLSNHRIRDDFNGRALYQDDSPDEEWQLLYNFLMQCLHFYLTTDENVFHS